ncbi:MAG: LamG-like jellyroll fold domain-containing protein [Bacteroidota bacterium]
MALTNPENYSSDLSKNDTFRFGPPQYFSFEPAGFDRKAFTISFWCNPARGGTVFFYGDPNEGNSYNSLTTYFSIEVGGRVQVGFQTGNDYGFSAPLPEEKGPYYVAVSFKQTDASVVIGIYVQGATKEVYADNSSEPFTFKNSEDIPKVMTLSKGSPVLLGTVPPDSSSDNPINISNLFEGSISDVRVWSYVMKKYEMEEDAARRITGTEEKLSTAHPLDTLNFDFQKQIHKDIVPREESAQKHHAEATSIPDSQTYGYSIGFNDFPVDSRCVAMWIRSGNNDSGNIILSYSDYTGSDIDNDRSNPWYLSDPSSLKIGNYDTRVNINDGKWHHLVTIEDPQLGLKVYVDGTSVKSISGFEMPVLKGGYQFSIATKNPNTLDEYMFNGSIKGLCFFNTPLTDAQVKEVMDSTSDDGGGDVNTTNTGLVAFLSMRPKVADKGNSRISINFSAFTPSHSPAISANEMVKRNAAITSRSYLTQDYDSTNLSNGKNVYRSTISVRPGTKKIYVRCDEPVSFTVNDTPYSTGPGLNQVELTPSIFNKVSISISPNGLHCPVLKVRTSEMQETHWHNIHPSVEVHKRLVDLDDNAFVNAKTAIGFKSTLSDDSIRSIQKLAQNISKSVKHTYHKRPHGVHRKQHFVTSNMTDPHFSLTYSNSGISYKALTFEESKQKFKPQSPIPHTRSGDFWSIIENGLKNTSNVFIHSLKKEAQDVKETVENVAHEAENTFHKVGEDIVHGDLKFASSDLIGGVSQIEGETVHGFIQLAEDVVSADVRMIGVTFETGGSLVSYVLDHSGSIGRLLNMLIKKAGIEVVKLIAWMTSKIDWGEVKNEHDKIYAHIGSGIDEIKEMSKTAEGKSDTFFNNLIANIQAGIQKPSGTTLTKPARTRPHKSQSGAHEKAEWLLNRYAHVAQSSNQTFTEEQLKKLDGLTNSWASIEEKLKSKAESASVLLKDDLERQMHLIAAHPLHAPLYLFDFFKDLVENIAVIGLEAVKLTMDLMFKASIAVLDDFDNMISSQIYKDSWLEKLYKEAVGNDKVLTVKGLMSLIVSIPISIIDNETKKPATRSLPDLSGDARKNGLSYGAIHIVLSIFSGTTDAILTATNIDGIKKENAAAGDPIESEWLSSTWYVNDRKPGFVNVLGLLLVSGSVALSFAAQMVSRPATLVDTNARDDTLGAPDYWSFSIWSLQWVSVLIGAFDTIVAFKGLRKNFKLPDLINVGLPYLNYFYGAAHISLMAVLHLTDKSKANLLKAMANQIPQQQMPAFGLGSNTLTWRDGIRNLKNNNVDLNGNQTLKTYLVNFYKGLRGTQKYWNFDTDRIEVHGVNLLDWLVAASYYEEWADENSNLAIKTTGNMMDSVPSIGKIFSDPALIKKTKGYSVFGTLALDFSGHLIEGSIYVNRTLKNELY